MMIAYDELSEDEKAMSPAEALATAKRTAEHIGQHKALHTQASVLAKCLAVLEHHQPAAETQKKGKRHG